MFVTTASGVNNMLGNINSLKLPDPWQHQAVNLLRQPARNSSTISFHRSFSTGLLPLIMPQRS